MKPSLRTRLGVALAPDRVVEALGYTALIGVALALLAVAVLEIIGQEVRLTW